MGSQKSEARSQTVVAIVGPTATGKSELGLQIAKSLPIEIISADSMQVYKGMDIGTAKVSPGIRKKVKHHLIDVISINEPFNVATYQQLARGAVEEGFQNGKIPVLVGGSGLYVRAALYKLRFPKYSQSPEVRQKLEGLLNEQGLEFLQEKLKEKDPEAYEAIDINNSRRLIRALEIIEKTGKPFSKFRQDWHNWQSLYDVIFAGLTMPRQQLYERINHRVDWMMEAGLLEETKHLVRQGLKETIIAKQALGYKELIDYSDGKMSLEQAIETLKKRTRNYAKRQYTWFKKDPNIEWYDVAETPTKVIANKIIQMYNKN